MLQSRRHIKSPLAGVAISVPSAFSENFLVFRSPFVFIPVAAYGLKLGVK